MLCNDHVYITQEQVLCLSKTDWMAAQGSPCNAQLSLTCDSGTEHPHKQCSVCYKAELLRLQWLSNRTITLGLTYKNDGTIVSHSSSTYWHDSLHAQYTFVNAPVAQL